MGEVGEWGISEAKTPTPPRNAHAVQPPQNPTPDRLINFTYIEKILLLFGYASRDT
jgi:hypothetical protein